MKNKWLIVALVIIAFIGMAGWLVIRKLATFEVTVFFEPGVTYERAREVLKSYGLQVKEHRNYTSQEEFAANHILTTDLPIPISNPSPEIDRWRQRLEQDTDIHYILSLPLPTAS